MSLQCIRFWRVAVVLLALPLISHPYQTTSAQCPCGSGVVPGIVSPIAHGGAIPLLPGQAAIIESGQIVAPDPVTADLLLRGQFAPGEVEAGTVQLMVVVPGEAKVFVNGDPTVSEGMVRHFVIRELDLERVYKFEIAAEMPNAAGVMMQAKTTLLLKPPAVEQVVLRPRKRKPLPPTNAVPARSVSSSATAPPMAGE